MVRREATAPTTGPAGVVLVASFAMVRTSMAVFKAGTTLLRPFRCWESSVMVETQGSGEKAVRGEGCEEEPEP